MKARMQTSIVSVPLVIVALLVLAPLTRADVLVVDVDDAGAPFQTIQSAVDAALDGDTVLVKAPKDEAFRYGPIVIDDKGLVIRGEGRPYLLTGAVTVQNLDADDTVVLHGLHMNRSTVPFKGTVIGGTWWGPPPVDPSGPGLHVAFSAGAVRVQECSMEGSVGARVWAGLQLTYSLDVSLVDCEVRGIFSEVWGEPGGVGVQTVASRLAAFGTRFEGGRGFEYAEHGSDGGSGLAMFQRSVLWIADCDVIGGAGGTSFCWTYPCSASPGDGGTGLDVQAGSIAYESGSTVQGGARGEIDLGTVGHAFGDPGEPGAPSSGVYSSFPDTHVSTAVASSRVRSGASARMTIIGDPGEAARVAVGRAGGFRLLNGTQGLLSITDLVDPAGFVSVGVIPATGILEVDVPLPAVGPATDSARYFLQVALYNAGTFRLSAPTSVFVDDSSVPSTFDRQVVRVDAGAAAGGDGRSWATACSTIDEAARVLPWEPTSGHKEVWMRTGVHHVESIGGVLLGPDCHVIGGFDGTETSAASADAAANPTVFEGDVLGDGSQAGFDDDNPGMFLRFGSLHMVAPGSGGCARGLTFSRAVRQVNPSRAGAVLVMGDAVISECSFENNLTCPLRHFEGHLRVERSLFLHNRSFHSASGIESEPDSYWRADIPSSVEVVSCSFRGNIAYYVGTMLVDSQDALRIAGSTFHANVCGGSSNPGAVNAWSVPVLSIIGSIMSGNQAVWYPGHPTAQIRYWGPTSLTFTHNCASDLSSSWQVDGNIAGAPGFMDPLGPNGTAGDADDDLRLAPGSPCIDAGDSNAFAPSDRLDIAGRPRIADDPGAPNTGVGGTRIPDMGAHER